MLIMLDVQSMVFVSTYAEKYSLNDAPSLL